MTQEIKCGDRVQDKITKLKGIVVSIADYLYGCKRVSIQPEEHKDGKPADWHGFDIEQVELLEAAVVAPEKTVPVKTKKTGGPRPDPTPR